MYGHPDTAATPVLHEGRFSGRSEFAERIRAAFLGAAAQGWQQMIWCDDDFDDWPLGERAVIESLQRWARTGRKLTLLARDYNGIVRRHARFVSWRQTFSHCVECQGSRGRAGDVLPSALWSPQWTIERLDLERSTGIASADAARRVAQQERLGALLQRSTPAFAATTIGL